MLLRATQRDGQRARRATPGPTAQLFRTLKFLRLLPVVTPAPGPGGGYRIELDGPFSLFQGGTRYGLQLGLALPAIAACDAWSVEADVALGRRPPRAQVPPRAASAAALADAPRRRCPTSSRRSSTAFDALASGWRVDREPAVLDLPGAGLCVPDLAFVRAADGARVYFELLGFWSREAVWRRVELVRAGLPHRILFAVSKSLRVGEAALDDTTPTAALYVFTRVINAKQVLGPHRATRPAGLRLGDGSTGTNPRCTVPGALMRAGAPTRFMNAATAVHAATGLVTRARWGAGDLDDLGRRQQALDLVGAAGGDHLVVARAQVENGDGAGGERGGCVHEQRRAGAGGQGDGAGFGVGAFEHAADLRRAVASRAAPSGARRPGRA